jgi:hypothetical protein
MATFKEFLATITKYSLSRSNRFSVIIPLPPALRELTPTNSQRRVSAFFDNSVVKLVRSYFAGSSTITRGLELMVEQTELPGKNINTMDLKYNGDMLKMPNGIIYAVQQFTFHVSSDMYEKNIIDEWMNLIIDPRTHEIGYMDDYSTNIIVNQLDERDNIVHSIVLYDAYPMNVNPLVIANSETNMTHRLMCMFAYRKWERIGESENDRNSLIDSLSQTPLGPYITPILNNPVVQKALDVFETNTGIDLEGEAIAIYNQLDDIVRATTGSSINKTVGLIEGIRAQVNNDDKLDNTQKAKILDLIEDILISLEP